MTTQEDILRTHVRESNLIEGIAVGEGNPLYDDHLKAARLAALGKFVQPCELHHLLGRRDFHLSVHAGTYRRVELEVGDRPMPAWEYVPVLLGKWLEMVQHFERDESGHGPFSQNLHAMLLCIHPFEDGNGRTARLVWNMLRVSKGLPWYVQRADEKYEYYTKIREFEDTVFKPAYAWMY